MLTLTYAERKCTHAQQLSWVLGRGMWIGVVQRRPVHHLAQECAAPIKRIDRGLSLSECSVPPDSYKTPGSISGWQHRDNEREKEDQSLAEAAHLPPLSSWGGRMPPSLCPFLQHFEHSYVSGYCSRLSLVWSLSAESLRGVHRVLSGPSNNRPGLLFVSLFRSVSTLHCLHSDWCSMCFMFSWTCLHWSE